MTSFFSIFTSLLGQTGVVIVVGIIIFISCYKYSIQIFDWIEAQTYRTRNILLEKFEFLFIDIRPEKITYMLLLSSFGLGGFVFMLFAIFGKWVLAIIMGATLSFIGSKLPIIITNILVERRIKAYTMQMVDALTLLSNGIRAGLTVPQALGMVVDEMPAPISEEFGIILSQNRIGVPLEECFENLVKRMPTDDNNMFVSSVNILRETGGNLAEVFDTIVEVIRERIRLQQKIETLTQQGRTQGYVISAMPFALGTVYALSDPDSMAPLFTTPLGLIMLFLSLAFNFSGLFVIMKIVKIKM